MNRPSIWTRADAAAPSSLALVQPVRQREYLVNGELRNWTGAMQEVVSPLIAPTASSSVIGSYPSLGRDQALEVLVAAEAAYENGRGFWPTLPLAARLEYFSKFAARMKETRADVVRFLMWEIGKSLADSEKEFDRTVKYIDDTIEAAKNLDRASSRFTIDDGVVAQIRRAPLGVVLCMGPFNYPLNETFTTLIPAMLMGNTVIFKPPKIGVLLHSPLLPIFRDVFPSGVINTVYGSGENVVGPLMESGRIDALAFIGSSRVAGILKSKHPKPYRLRSVLGLEAKNVGIILADADIDLTVRECVLGSLSFNGQRCTAIKMIFVHSSIASTFLQKFSDAVEALKAGLPWEPGVAITPLAEPAKTAAMKALIDDAVRAGASVVNPSGGTVDHTLMYPAIVSPVNASMRLYREEQFGPVVPVASFESIEEPLSYIADSPYGQQVSLFGSDSDEMAAMIDGLVNQVCRVNINSQCQRGPDTFPFTGRKDSAEGTLSVSDALRVFSIRTLVAAKENALNKRLLEEMVRERKSSFLSTDFVF